MKCVTISAKPDCAVRLARALRLVGYEFNEACRIVQSRQDIPEDKALELIGLLGSEADEIMELAQ